MLQRYYQTVRLLHRTCPQMARKKAMPGIRHQLEALENAPDLVDGPDRLEDLETDFMQLANTHRQHEAELRAQRERVRHIMVKNKYFREQRLPNFLFYSEKEEMRLLHSRDPDEWTIERLTESFPATPEIVKKVLNSKWRPHSEKRIREHDEAVIRNWEYFKSNQKDESFLPPEMRENLSKFAARIIKNPATQNQTAALLPRLPTPKSNEFSSIITSCKKYAARTKKLEGISENVNLPKERKLPDPEDETFLLNEVKDKRHMRLQDLQEHKTAQLENSHENPFKTAPSNENNIVVTPENPSGTGYIQKFESNEIVISTEDSKLYEMSTYKERVHIPRKLWRKGFTYRVEDCYYDDDGEFLYRVPGMSGIQHSDDKKSSSHE